MNEAGTPWGGRTLHFVGAGGAGMSGLAVIARRLGARVSGCDRAASEYTELLEREGIEITIGHDASHAAAGVELVYSTAIPFDAPELEAARRLGEPVHHRAELLAAAARLRDLIAVSGTHGKTTTSAMIAHCLTQLGMDPGYAIGASLPAVEGPAIVNASWGSGRWMVVEADESDRSFLSFEPRVAVVTNMELDHHATYGSRLDFEQAFREFIDRTLERGGTAIAWQPIAGRLGHADQIVTFGVEVTADLRAVEIASDRDQTSFSLLRGGRAVCDVRLPAPGEHNVLNALAALCACEAAGADLRQAALALAQYRPAGRRFEEVGEAAGATVVDDYAHHPTEIAATLAAARQLEPRLLLAIFQPHLYSRTLALHREFGRALAEADEVVVLDVYAARELAEGALEGVTGKLVADAAADAAAGRPVWWLPTLDEAEPIVRRRLRPGTLVLTLGAGDVTELAHRLVAGNGA